MSQRETTDRQTFRRRPSFLGRSDPLGNVVTVGFSTAARARASRCGAAALRGAAPRLEQRRRRAVVAAIAVAVVVVRTGEAVAVAIAVAGRRRRRRREAQTQAVAHRHADHVQLRGGTYRYIPLHTVTYRSMHADHVQLRGGHTRRSHDDTVTRRRRGRATRSRGGGSHGGARRSRRPST